MSVRRRKWKDRKAGQEKVVWIVDIDFEHPDGRRTRVRKTSPVQTRKGAEEYERQVRAELLAGTYERTEEVKNEEELPTFGSAGRTSTLRSGASSSGAASGRASRRRRRTGRRARSRSASPVSHWRHGGRPRRGEVPTPPQVFGGAFEIPRGPATLLSIVPHKVAPAW